jgi:ABC-type phosphate transport system substrate-binding protein
MSKILFVVAAALGAIASPSAAAPDEIVVIVNKDNDVEQLSLEQLEAIFTMSQRQWNGGSSIVAFSYEPGNETRIEFDRVVLHLSPEQVGRFWRDQRIRTGVHPPRQVADPALALRLTAKMTAAIVYVPAGTVTSSVRIVARIRGGKVLAPSRPK